MRGPGVGALLVTAMQHYFAPLGSWVTVVQGVIFVFCVLLFRRGIVGVIASYSVGARKAPTSPEKPAEIGTAAAPGTS